MRRAACRATRVFLTWLAVSLALGAGAGLHGQQPATSQPAKNVIVLIADGCSAEHFTLARWFKGSALATDDIRCGMVKTHSAESTITDSAPAASAYATGHRTSDRMISVGPKPGTLPGVPEPAPELQYRPLATVLEGARLLGKATGIVVTCRISHATPAAYIAHSPSRAAEADLMEQAVYQGIDVVLGGGKDQLLPKSAGGKRADGEDLLEVLRARGYAIVENGEALTSHRAGKVFGLFASGPMAPEIDRPKLVPEEPTLDQMTRKAIELLSADADGFFLMVEASQVDWGSHANDPALLLGELMAYDGAVGAALEFARRDGRTLVLALSDHNTGGLSIGNLRTAKSHDLLGLAELIDPLRKMRCSAAAMWQELCGPPEAKGAKPREIRPEAVRKAVRENWGLDITEDDARQILAIAGRSRESGHNAFGEVLCPRYTCIGWTTHSHCGGDVPLGAFGPNRPTGTLENEEIGRATAAALGVDLAATTERLLAEAGRHFPEGAVTIDAAAPENPVAQIRFGGKTARLPINANRLELDGRTIELEGVVVYIANTKRLYLPAQAVRLIKGESGSR